MIYLTGDNHFNHGNIVEYCRRPYVDLMDMNTDMMYKWNILVNPQDTVYHAGDIAFGGRKQLKHLKENLNGTIHIVKGNHDRTVTSLNGCGFIAHKGPYYIKEYKVWMIHDPKDIDLIPIHELRYPVLCGHVHEKWKTKKHNQGLIINVGVDVWNFTPITFHEVLILMNGNTE